MSDTYRRQPTEPDERDIPEPDEVWTYADQAEADLAWQQRVYADAFEIAAYSDAVNGRAVPHLTVIRGGRAGS